MAPVSSEKPKRVTFSHLAARILQHRDSRIQVGSFAKAVHDLLKNDEEYPGSSVYCRNVLPDAFRFDVRGRQIFIYEIEDQNPLTIKKLRDLADLFYQFDEFEWTLRLIVCDRYGTNQRELDIVEYDVVLNSLL